jgi:cation:H+ antiporter
MSLPAPHQDAALGIGTFVLFLAGLGLLPAGAAALVKGASRLAAAFGLSGLVIGLTVVAFGTSAPELAVSLQAGLEGNPSIAVGNVVGSNILNVLLVLGACALILPLRVDRQLVRVDVPIMIGVSALLWLMALDGRLGFVDGALLWAGIVIYTAVAIQVSRAGGIWIAPRVASPPGFDGSWNLDPAHPRRAVAASGTAARGPETPARAAPGSAAGGRAGPGAGPPARPGPGALLASAALVAGGLAMLILGSDALVDGAVAMAVSLGVSNAVVGLTVVAIGTSLPEIVTSIVATLRGERDMALGNVVGSNIFNVLAILGLTGLVTPGGIAVEPALLRFDLPVMVVAALICFPVFVSGLSIGRWEGVLLLGYYAAYTFYLILSATGSAALPGARRALAVVVPLALVPLAVSFLRAVRWRSASWRAGA